MLRYEWKKMLLRRGGWLLILGLLLAELGGLLLFTAPYDGELEQNRGVYDSYLAQVVGPLDETKRDFLEAEMTRLEGIHRKMDLVKQSYYSGTIAEEEYREQFNALLPEDQKYTGFTKLYSQYIFVREADNRSFLYTGGWELLLTDWMPDYLFLAVLVILLSPVFCEEYACGMHGILLTQRKSARYTVLTKLAAALLMTGVLTALLQAFEVIYMAVRFGLPNGEFTIQSLATFAHTTRSLTLWQAFWLQFALKELGCLYAAVVILLLSVVLKKFALTLMAGLAILPLPFLTVNDPAAFLKIPGPWALSIGSIYLGREQGLSGLLLAVAAILAGMLLIIARQNTNWQLRGKKAVAILTLSCVLLLSGCGSEKPPVYYNRSDSQRYETEEYLIASDHIQATITDKTTGAVRPFPLDALEGNTVSCDAAFFGVGDTVYYKKNIRIYKTPSGESEYGQSYDVYVKLDLNTMEETVLYQWNASAYWFFDQLVRQSWGPSSVTPLFVHGNRLYFTQNSTLGYMDMTTGAYSVLYESVPSADLAYDGENIYCLDGYSRLVIENLNTEERIAVDEVVASRFLLTPEGLFFLNRRDSDTLYRWDSQTGAAEKCSDISAVLLARRSDGLWLTDIAGNAHCLNHDGTANKLQ